MSAFVILNKAMSVILGEIQTSSWSTTVYLCLANDSSHAGTGQGLSYQSRIIRNSYSKGKVKDVISGSLNKVFLFWFIFCY